MSTKDKYRKILESKYKEEIFVFAIKVGFKDIRGKSKTQLIDDLLGLNDKQLRSLFKEPSLWSKYHNHFYGIITIIGAISACIFYIRPIILPSPLKANDISFEVHISGWNINENLLDKVPHVWQGKASISRLKYFEFDMNLMKAIHYPSSRGASTPTAIYKAENVRLPITFEGEDKLTSLNGLTLRVYVPFKVWSAFGQEAECSLKVQSPNNWIVSGSTKCQNVLEVNFKN